MSKFALERIDAVRGKHRFDQLVVNGVSQLDNFEKDLVDTTYKSEFNTILAYMDLDANEVNIGSKKKELKGGDKSVKEYEYRTKHLRVYAIQQLGGKIIVLGGYKKDQDRDLKRFRSLKKQYLQSQQS